MKTFSKAELQALAKPLFTKLGVSKLYATTDGQFFILPNRATLHAGKTLTVYELESEAEEVAEANGEENAQLKVKDIVAAIAEETDMEVLKKYLFDEIGGPNRASAVKAIEKRLETVVSGLNKDTEKTDVNDDNQGSGATSQENGKGAE